MSRVKLSPLKSRFEFEEAINRVAEIELSLRKHAAARDEAIQTIQDQFKPVEGELQAQLKGWLGQAEKYAETHRDELFPNKVKSSATSLAVFGFRLGNPTLALLNRAWTWLQVAKTLHVLGLTDLIQETIEPRKDAIKARGFSDSELSALGMRMTQSETFFIEPKLEGADAVKSEPVRS
jgi:phage host-nuclease inhibitor protein Gam